MERERQNGEGQSKKPQTSIGGDWDVETRQEKAEDLGFQGLRLKISIMTRICHLLKNSLQLDYDKKDEEGEI